MTPPVDVAEEKEALRRQYRAARLALSDAEYRTASGAICERLAELPEIRDAATISIYYPLVAKKEIDTRPLIEMMVARGRTVVIPCVVSHEGRPAMRHVPFGGDDHLEAGRWGLLEPRGLPIPVHQIDAIVVPAICAGRNGHRLGHGKGYYDAFLSIADAPAIGVVHSTCLLPDVPAEPHDAPLEAIVTEAETVRPSP